MFDIAWSELLLIAVLALIFIGPKELPQVLHTLGKATAKLRRTADDFRRQFEESMRESGYEDLHKNIQDFRSLNPTSQLKESIDRAVNQEYTPKPAPSVEPANSQPAIAEAPSTQYGDPSNTLHHETLAEPTVNGFADTHTAAPSDIASSEPEVTRGHETPPPVPQTTVDEAAKDRAAPVA